MNQVIPFTFESTKVRMFEESGKVFFCGKDVATALGYVNTKDALAKHCKGVAKRYPLQTAGGIQQIRFITEGDLYRLTASSKLPSAQAFEAKVFDEVLPTIRKTGSYGTPANNQLEGRALMAKALIEADKTLKALEAENARLEPKAKSFDKFLATGKDLSIKQAAQMLCRAGLETGQNRLYKTLDALGWVYKPAGRKSWSVYQKVIDAGHMAVIASTWEDPTTGERFVTTTPRITAKGLYRLAKLFGLTIPSGSRLPQLTGKN
ncbi:phage antirepressor KilAC domain-containing protein [Winkia sp. UMB0889B]|uniref:phage antirepressor KilAC domain-containing protein n=1 Tax=Winkia sp. UMB0889B TaxID=3046315 RepID=UPI002553F9D9|nr:phage antirepressor KilAC domain-containing protein [Winkia sp. UMB0889B]MDK7904842.1 phage antirepressor KilAC domain-containing protein [Winkia sp. UMB0889B]